MEHGWWKTLQRILDATAFENVGHLRDFEELLERSPKPEAVAKTDLPAAPVRDARVANDTHFS